MSRPQLEHEGASIVLRGTFNPLVFQPAWFTANELIPPGEVLDESVVIVRADLCSFATDWLRLEATRDRLMAATALAHRFATLRDLVVGVLELVPDTPVRYLGINHEVHYAVESEEAWHAIGHRLAPKDVWASILDAPGMQSVRMQGKRVDGHVGAINVRVEPSTIVPTYGVFIAVNDHFEIGVPDTDGTGQDAVTVIRDQWVPSAKHASQVFEHIVGLQ